MSRTIDFVVLVVVIFATLTVQFAGAMALDDTRDAVTKNDAISDAQLTNIDEIYESAIFWSPLIVQLGSIAIVGWREWRRQRVTAVSRRQGSF